MFNSGMCAGEKVETIIFSRRSGKFGDYLGSLVQTFGAARVDDIIFKVERNNNVGCAWFWKVRNVETGLVSTAKDRNDLYLAVREVA